MSWDECEHDLVCPKCGNKGKRISMSDDWNRSDTRIEGDFRLENASEYERFRRRCDYYIYCNKCNAFIDSA
jgi:hypothetical protein